MRKAYRKARWKRMVQRARKRGDTVFFGYKTIHHVEAPKKPLTLDLIIKRLAELGYEWKE